MCEPVRFHQTRRCTGGARARENVRHLRTRGYQASREWFDDRDTGDWKYLVKGQTTAGDHIAVVAKLSLTGKLVIVTAYRE
jgi:hypothetical protein